MPDEFLPSFELRLRMINGDTQNISSLEPFSSSDCRFWYVLPLTRKKDLFFTNTDDSTLQKLILNHTYAHKFWAYNDVYFIPRMISLLKGRNVRNERIRPYRQDKRFSVKFCKHCFIAQIREFGFAWFRLPWLTENEVCDVHQRPLEPISCKKCVQNIAGLNALVSVLSGKCFQCSQPLYLESDDFIEYRTSKTEKYHTPPIAPCFELELKEIFRRLQKRGEKKFRKLNSINSLSFLERKALLFNFFSFKTKSRFDSFNYQKILNVLFSGDQEKLLNYFSNLWTKRYVKFKSVKIVQKTVVGISSNCDTCPLQRGCIY